MNGKKTLKQILPILLCILVGLLFGFFVLLLTNREEAFNGFRTILFGGFSGGIRGVGNVLYYATPVMMVGLGISLGFKAGVFNIGGPGQFVIGGFLATYFAINLPFEGPMRWILPIIFAAVGGAVWASIAGILKAYFKVNVVISTILLNYIAMYLVNYMIKHTIYDSSTNKALPVPKASQLPTAGLEKLFEGSSVNIGFFIAVIFAVITYILLTKTNKGYEIVATGFNPNASKYLGMNEKFNTILTMIISGALIGIGGALMYLASSGKSISVVDSLAAEGFNGIPVALLAFNNPLGVILSSVFIGYITVGGFYMQSYRFVPEIVDIIIAVILYFSAFSLLISQNLNKIVLVLSRFPKKKAGEK